MLTSHRLHLARLQLADPEQAELLRAALPLALGPVLDELQPGDGRWLLLRRVPAVELALSADAGLHEAIARLQPAVRRALRAALADPAEAVFAPDAATLRAESWVDALGGRIDRAWAWQRLGLWPVESDMPRAALLTHALATLDRDLPELPDPATPPQRRRLLLNTLLARGLLPRWLALADATHWARLSLGLPGAAPLAALVAEALAGTVTSLAPQPGGAGPSGATAAAVYTTWSRTPLPEAARPVAALHLAWVAWLLAEPLALQGPPAATRLLALSQALLAGLQPDPASGRPGSRPAAALSPPAVATEASVIAETPAAGTSAAAAAEPAAFWPTSHAGLLHLLAALPQLLPGELDAERLLRLAHHGLQIPLDDPVLGVLLGHAEPATDLREPQPDPWHTSADRMACDDWLSERLHRHLPPERLRELPVDTLAWLVRREARLLPEPGGWCARFREADPLLRRCGLDRDPGHLPWLGLSVRLQYGGDEP